eukprot:PITA_31862
MGYLYEAMDKAKESIWAYYDDKGDEGFQKQLLLWEVIDEQWNNTFHRPIHAVGIYLNPTFSYPCGFLFDAEIMDRFLTCVQRMVRSPAERAEISKEMEIYKMAGGTFGFEMAMHGGLAMLSKYRICESLPFESLAKHVVPEDAISLNGIDTTAAWRVEAETPPMESADDWLEQEVVEGIEGEEAEVTPPSQATPATSRGRGLPPVAPSSSASRAQ